ncbi:hypothetical protein RB195_017908 [Necator americanus]|uniref:Uncharacterized protein n=1 Tax=Necator americanus TaxID=51031 RepID=A0ABR1C7A4_NECAM
MRPVKKSSLLVMKLLPEGIKQEWTHHKEKESENQKKDDEVSLVSSVIPDEKPKSSSSRIADVAKNTVHTLLDKKKEACCLRPQKCCILSDKSCVSKLPGVRQLKEKFVAKEASA